MVPTCALTQSDLACTLQDYHYQGARGRAQNRKEGLFRYEKNMHKHGRQHGRKLWTREQKSDGATSMLLGHGRCDKFLFVLWYLYKGS
eukprot:c22538_g1_i1 orf=433-696(-)